MPRNSHNFSKLIDLITQHDDECLHWIRRIYWHQIVIQFLVLIIYNVLDLGKQKKMCYNLNHLSDSFLSFPNQYSLILKLLYSINLIITSR